ncbi:uncharacterized protein BJX67DRAFT_375674 [Aspergillus lucknowensis]|uniref:Rhodopsin domain-containing protein n=1 Tax=Aspergillus lucknowensis TaxID=176173 RepID=A0ABR4L8X0_9EURO
MSSNLFDILHPQGVATHLSEGGLIAVTWTGAGLGVLFTGCRLAIRITRMKRLLADDYFILLALFFLVANAILQTLQAPHLYYIILTPMTGDIVYHSQMYVHFMFVIIGLFWSVLWSVKAAFLALFWGMTDHLPHYRRWWWGIVVVCVGSYAGCWLTSAFTCHPPSDYFKFAKCTKDVDQQGSTIAISYSTAVDILTDLMIMGFALSIVWSTRITFRQKVGLGVVFSLGAIIIAFSVVRAINITGRAYSDQAGLAVWSIAESSISVIVGCLPPFKTFLSRSNSSYTSRYPPTYDRSGQSARQKRSLTHTTSWSEMPLEGDYELSVPKVHISRGNRGGSSPEGEIRVTQGFSVLRE